MSTRLERGVRAVFGRGVQNTVSVASLQASGGLAASAGLSGGTASAMKLSTVNRCIELVSDSMGKLPIYLIDRKSREEQYDPILDLLTVRPNEAQTPTVFKKMVEANRLSGGDGYIWIMRDPCTLTPRELIPIPYQLVTPWKDDNDRIWFTVVNPVTGTPMTINRADMCHVMAYTSNGWKGESVLKRASEVIASARAAQQYTMAYYQNGGQPSGVLQTESDLNGEVVLTMPDGTTQKVRKKDLIRNEWESRHSGPANANRIVILDHGLSYHPISISNKDAQFVEQSDLSIHDIARFFGVPLYKLGAGKESYQSNEQNAIEYVVSTLHPIVNQYEEEYKWKLLPAGLAKSLDFRINMMAELRGDFKSRADWYKTLREIGVYSVNDIRALEDLPNVTGGDSRYASFNYGPLSEWEALSLTRNGGKTEK